MNKNLNLRICTLKKEIAEKQEELLRLEEERSDTFVMIYERWFGLMNAAKLNYGELILLSKINSLTNNRISACTAKNSYFAELMKVSEDTIKKYIRKLKQCNLIETREQKMGFLTNTRFIRVNYEVIEELLGEGGGDLYTVADTINSSQGENETAGQGELNYETAKKVLSGKENCNGKIENKRIKKNSLDTYATATPALENIPSQTVSDELTKEVFEMFTKKKKYSEIQDATGLDFDSIREIIDVQKNDRKQRVNNTDNKEYILKADGSYSSFSQDNFMIDPEDVENFFYKLTDVSGEYQFDVEYVSNWFKAKYNWRREK